MVPHLPSLRTSTRPSPSLGPAFSRTGWIRKQRQIAQSKHKVEFGFRKSLGHNDTLTYHHWIWSLGSSRRDAGKLRTWHALDHRVSTIFARHRTSGYWQLGMAFRQGVFTAQTVNFFNPKSLLLCHETQSVHKKKDNTSLKSFCFFVFQKLLRQESLKMESQERLTLLKDLQPWYPIFSWRKTGEEKKSTGVSISSISCSFASIEVTNINSSSCEVTSPFQTLRYIVLCTISEGHTQRPAAT